MMGTRLRILVSMLTIVSMAFSSASLAAAENALPGSVRSVLNVRNLPDDSLSIYVESIDSGEPILAWNEDVPRNPASVMKMLTTLVALETLGPAYRWKTNIYLLGDVENGTLDGDILLQGKGDPYLVTERFWQMLRMIRQAGITRIDGDLLLDDSYFDVPVHDPAAFDREPLRAYNVGPNALLSNFKVVRYVFEPEPTTGKVRVRLDPEIAELRVRNRLTVAAGSCRGYQRGITVTMNEALDEVTFSGRFPAGCDVYSMDRAVLNHNQYTYSLFKSLWLDSGGHISGSWRNVITPGELMPDLTFRSMPLSEVISKVNKHSNNVMARQLLYTLGAEVNGAPGTDQAGRDAIRNWLETRGFDQSAVTIQNGAGLSRDVRITSRLLVSVLRHAYESPYMPEFLSSLSLSGLDGTMSHRFRNDELTGRAHMKTGSLDHVSAIGGYFQARSGQRYLVVTLQNYTDIHRGPGEEVQTALLKWLNSR